MNFLGGHRFLFHLGFLFETRLEGCGPKGEAYALYVRGRFTRTEQSNRYYALQRKALVCAWEDEVAPLPANSLNFRRAA